MTAIKAGTRRCDRRSRGRFNFANQAYTLLIITVVFGDLFTRVIVVSPALRDAWHSEPRLPARPSTMQEKDVMTTPVISVSEQTQVHDMVRLLLEHRISAVPVVGADQRVLGMVSEDR